MNLITRLVAMVGLAVSSTLAGATSCGAVLHNYAVCLGGTFTFNCSLSSIVLNNPECFAGSSTNSQIQINETSFAQAHAISRALSVRFMENVPGGLAASDSKGMAAGGVAKAWNVWANATDNKTRQSYDVVLGGAKTSNTEADVLNSILGADYALSSTMVIGVSGAFDRGSGSGSNTAGSQNDTSSHGYQIAPYVGMQLSKELALDASVGFGAGRFTSGGSVTSDANRWFAGANLSYNQWLGNTQLTGKLTYLHGEESYGDSKNDGVSVAKTAAKNAVDQVRAGVQAGYWMDGVMPYAGLAYASDVRRTTTQFAASVDPIGKNAWVWTLGVNFFSLSSGITGGVTYNREEDRSHQKNNSLIANIGFRF